ncbi:uncharacterized protein PAC_16974 [Phialocephala subalpina]|uniref:Uncharacterized protein n=1 Tax=Phialocephala subalpina TaxID=576137 RepID=A0A1L7XPY1_9HELO|nr:uncharacterized protein PAC_16974 [Phialocephala subalpina]
MSHLNPEDLCTDDLFLVMHASRVKTCPSRFACADLQAMEPGIRLARFDSIAAITASMIFFAETDDPQTYLFKGRDILLAHLDMFEGLTNCAQSILLEPTMDDPTSTIAIGPAPTLQSQADLRVCDSLGRLESEVPYRVPINADMAALLSLNPACAFAFIEDICQHDSVWVKNNAENIDINPLELWPEAVCSMMSGLHIDLICGDFTFLNLQIVADLKVKLGNQVAPNTLPPAIYLTAVANLWSRFQSFEKNLIARLSQYAHGAPGMRDLYLLEESDGEKKPEALVNTPNMLRNLIQALLSRLDGPPRVLSIRLILDQIERLFMTSESDRDTSSLISGILSDLMLIDHLGSAVSQFSWVYGIERKLEQIPHDLRSNASPVWIWKRQWLIKAEEELRGNATNTDDTGPPQGVERETPVDVEGDWELQGNVEEASVPNAWPTESDKPGQRYYKEGLQQSEEPEAKSEFITGTKTIVVPRRAKDILDSILYNPRQKGKPAPIA